MLRIRGLIGTHPDRDALSTSRAAAPASPERCSDLGARLLDTTMLLLATTCFVHAHDVSQSRSRRASRRAVCLTPVIDAAEAQNIMSTKAAREVLTTDAMNHLVSFGPCINSCRLPALAPIHSPCPEWSCNVCLYPAPCPCSVAACVMSCAYRLALSVRLDLACHLECDLCCHASCDGNTASFAQQPAHLAGPILSELANVNGAR